MDWRIRPAPLLQIMDGFDGYLSIAHDGSSRVETEWDACLPTDSHGYYFLVPPPPGMVISCFPKSTC
jgi:hypothetical protein